MIEAVPGPILCIDAQVIVTTTQEEWSIEQRNLIKQRLRRLKIATQGRLARAEDAGLLEGDRLTGITQPVGMIDADTGDQSDIGIQQIHCIQPAAKADLQHQSIQPSLLE